MAVGCMLIHESPTLEAVKRRSFLARSGGLLHRREGLAEVLGTRWNDATYCFADHITPRDTERYGAMPTRFPSR